MGDFSVSQLLGLGFDTVHLSRRPLPEAPTGYYDWQITTDPSDDVEGHSKVTNFINRIEAFKAKGGFQPKSGDFAAFIDAAQNPTAVDDRKLIFATGLGMLAKLDPDSDMAKKLNDVVINTLYNTVPHPPSSYLGPEHAFRSADGSGNNLFYPNIGRSGTAYARSVQAKAGLPRSSLPDPGMIFDAILKRKRARDHQGGMSNMIFAFASLVTHSLFRTDFHNMHINNASSYLDLSPLYGDNQAAQDQVRDKQAGRGLLYPDTFSEGRLVFLPPASSVLLVLFSRNHNYIAEKILKINEKKRWSDPPPTDEAQRTLQDEEIFQTARLVNCGHFMSAILGDYVAGFLGSSEGANWNMRAFDEIRGKELNVPRGEGNHVSVEFNILYRWHATMSESDEEWTNGVFRQAFGNKPFDEYTMADFALIGKVFAELNPNPSERTFGNLKRGPDGRFNDDDLAKVLYQATEVPAGTYGGRGTPAVLRLVEMVTIEQARGWGVCTMNEFRKFLGLKEFETFEEWNPDPEIAQATRKLYGHVDNLELYVGLQAEATMPLMPGSNFACGFTMTRAVLGDAIALIRGDRFFTTDYTPANLTTWGFYDCQRHMNNGAGGGQIPRLILRHLPLHFPYTSIYAAYPFFTPKHMKESMTRQGLEKKYTFDRPVPISKPKVLNTFKSIKTVFAEPQKFKHIYDKVGYGSVLMFDEVKKHDTDKALVLHSLFPDHDAITSHAAWMGAKTRELIAEKSTTLPNTTGRMVEISNSVINMVLASFSAEVECGVELKTKANPNGVYTPNEWFDMVAALLVNTVDIFDNGEIGFALNKAAEQGGLAVGAAIAKALIQIAPSTSPSIFQGLASHLSNLIWSTSSKPWYPFMSRMLATGRKIDELVGLIIGLTGGSMANFSCGTTNIVEFYLDDARKAEREHIIKLVKMRDQDSAALLRGYVCEAMRLRPPFFGLWRQANVSAVVDQGPGFPPINIQAGDRIRASIKNAHLNPNDYPEPHKVIPTRPYSSYANLNGAGFHNCPGTNMAVQVNVEIIRAIFSLKNIRRAPGDLGKLHKISEISHETEIFHYIQRNGTLGPFPGPWFIMYDD